MIGPCWTFTDTQFGDYALYATPSGDKAVSGGLGKRGESEERQS